MSCMVKGCPNKRRNNSNASFHRFPRGRLEKKWLRVLGISDGDWTWSKNKNVCSEHFKPSDFNIRSGKNCINLNALPSLFPDSENSIVVSEPSTSISYLDASSSITSNESSIQNVTSKKRKLNKAVEGYQSLEKSGTSTDSSTKRRRVQFIKSIHSYSTSPTVATSKNIQVRKRQQRYRKQLFSARQRIDKLKREVTTLRTVTQFLRQGQFISDNAVEHLERNSDSVPHLLMSRYMKNIRNNTITHETYPSVLREFAATLQFYSCKAYEEVRQLFNLALPHQATIRKWFKNVDCHPGFISQAFQALKLKSEEAISSGRDLICSLMLDEMSIKKQIEFDNKKIWGYIDIGTHSENDELEPATEALVLMVVSHKGHWKIPIAYFFIKSLSGRERASIVENSLICLHEIGVQITSLTCDGPSTHFTMMRELGCDFQNIVTLLSGFGFYKHSV